MTSSSTKSSKLIHPRTGNVLKQANKLAPGDVIMSLGDWVLCISVACYVSETNDTGRFIRVLKNNCIDIRFVNDTWFFETMWSPE
jgi:hypothetical protein